MLFPLDDRLSTYFHDHEVVLYYLNFQIIKKGVVYYPNMLAFQQIIIIKRGTGIAVIVK